MALSPQNLPCKTVQWSMCLTWNALFPLCTRMSHLPIEFSLLPPTCKRNLIGSNSNLYSDKVVESDKKKKKEGNKPSSWRPPTVYFFHSPLFVLVHHPSNCVVTLQTAIPPSRFPIFTHRHPKVHNSFHLLPKLSFTSPVCGPMDWIRFHVRLPPPFEFPA